MADALNAPRPIPNPNPRGQVPAAFGSIDAAALLGPADLAKIIALPAFDATIRPLLDRAPKTALDVLALDRWAASLFRAGDLTQGEYDALEALFHGTVPDPAWTATVPGPSWIQATFPGVEFRLPRPANAPDSIVDGGSLLGQVNAAIVEEALG
jgi:hypothetical protein